MPRNVGSLLVVVAIVLVVGLALRFVWLWFGVELWVNTSVASATRDLLHGPDLGESGAAYSVASDIRDCIQDALSADTPCPESRFGRPGERTLEEGTKFDTAYGHSWVEGDPLSGAVHYVHHCCMEREEALFEAWPLAPIHFHALGDLRTHTGIRLGSPEADVIRVYGPGFAHFGADTSDKVYVYRRSEKYCSELKYFVIRSGQVVAIQIGSDC